MKRVLFVVLTIVHNVAEINVSFKNANNRYQSSWSCHLAITSRMSSSSELSVGKYASE